jgi:YidC/Oxa1 family membrane protein insertase
LAEYKNPNQQGGQDSSLLLVFTLIIVVVLIGMEYFRPKTAPTAPAPAAQQQSLATAAAPTPGSPAPGSPIPAAVSAQAASAAVPAKAAAAESTTTIDNPLYRITFSNRGARVTSWILKNYTDDAGKPLDLVHAQAAQRFGYPLSVYTYDANLRTQLAQALYVPSATGNLTAPAQVSFEYAAGGLEVKKTFRFDDSYVLHADVSVTMNGAPVEALLTWPSGFGDQQTDASSTRGMSSYLAQLDISSNGKAESIAAKKVSGGGTQNGPFDWAGVSDLYFAAIFLPDAPEQSTLVSFSNILPATTGDAADRLKHGIPILGAAVGAPSGATSLRIFVGPKQLGLLHQIHAMSSDGKATGPDLVPIVHYGIWSFMAKPLFYALRWMHNHIVANWGWAILLFTVVITLAMLPTRITMMKSSIKMQRVQPQMNAIKEKYKKYKFDDPRKRDMNVEMQQLYRDEGINMFGGCLPMLIQFPLIFAFYAMLENAIELRHAHWFWLHDLSAPDPYHILPILMVVSQFAFQLFTPTPGVDAAQQKMMAFTMPLFSGFITWHYASGLALYWACSNMIGIFMQLGINRTSLGKELRAIQAKRAAKKQGKPALARR